MSLIPRIPGLARRLGELAHLDKKQAGIPLRGYIDGFNTSNDTDTDHDISFGAGQATDEGEVRYITRNTAVVKQIDAAYAAGTNQGGLATALTLSASTWYHGFVLSPDARHSQVDAGFDTALTATNLITSASNVVVRRVISVKTDGASNIRGYSQTGDHVIWNDPPQDHSGNIASGTGTLITLSTPPDVRTVAILHVEMDTNAARRLYVTTPTQTDTEPSATQIGQLYTGGAQSETAGQIMVKTDTSSRVRVRTNGTVNVRVQTYGWIDWRGKDD